jgi:hypothetical protein
MDQPVDQRFARKVASRQKPSDGNAERQAAGDTEEGDPQAKADRLPLDVS